MDRDKQLLPAETGAESSLASTLLQLANDPSNAIWEPSWCGSASFTAAVSAQHAILSDAVYASTAGGLSASALSNGAAAARELANLLQRARLERAANVLAILRSAGVSVGIKDGKLVGRSCQPIASEHREMAKEWYAELMAIVSDPQNNENGKSSVSHERLDTTKSMIPAHNGTTSQQRKS